uniref:Kinesin light chain 1 n=1 Tax=Sphaerodactylus townsendi TaxID=933632 RepID=A0ACB8G6R9_9SAUR
MQERLWRSERRYWEKIIQMFAKQLNNLYVSEPGERRVQRREAKRWPRHSVNTGGWYKACKVDSPTVTTTLKNLGALYRRQGKYEAAETLEEAAMRSRKQRVAEVLNDPESIERRRSRESLNVDVVKYESGPDGGEEVSMSVEWNGVLVTCVSCPGFSLYLSYLQIISTL